MLETPGAKDCRRYQLEWASGDVPEYLAIYGLENPAVPRSPAWKAQTNKGAWPVEIRPNFTARRNGIYSRIAEHRSEEHTSEIPVTNSQLVSRLWLEKKTT